MGELCLMASHGYPPGLVLHQEQGMSRVIKDCQPYLPCYRARQEVIRSDSFNLKSSGKSWNPLSGLCESNQLVKLDSTVTRPLLIDVQVTKMEMTLRLLRDGE